VKEEAGCMRWYGDLMDTRVLKEGQNLYVRVDAVELGTLNNFPNMHTRCLKTQRYSQSFSYMIFVINT
jgi:hypothetical protein